MALRKKFDVGFQSHIHMTDNTYQTLEYIDVLYPEQLSKYKDSINEIDKHFNNNTLVDFLFILIYKLKTFPRKFKDRLMEKLRSLI
jgi:hypothetical protein